MKTHISAEKIIPFIEDKLSVKFQQVASGSMVQRKTNESGLVLDPSEENTVIAKISTIDCDRSGEVVIPEGMDAKDFGQNPVTCWGHDYSEPPVGKIVKLQATDTAIYAKIVFGSTDRCKEIYTLVKEGILSSCSIGFVATEIIEKGKKGFNEFIQANMSRLGDVSNVKKIISKWTLLENSIVTLPCNQNAVVVMKGLGISEKMIKEFEVIIDQPGEEGKPKYEEVNAEAEVIPDPDQVPAPIPPEDKLPAGDVKDDSICNCPHCNQPMPIPYESPEEPKLPESAGDEVKEEILPPDNAGSTPEEAFTPSEITDPDKVEDEVINGCQGKPKAIPKAIPDEVHEYKSFFTVIHEPVEVLAEKEVMRKKGKIR